MVGTASKDLTDTHANCARLDDSGEVSWVGESRRGECVRGLNADYPAFIAYVVNEEIDQR